MKKQIGLLFIFTILILVPSCKKEPPPEREVNTVEVKGRITRPGNLPLQRTVLIRKRTVDEVNSTWFNTVYSWTTIGSGTSDANGYYSISYVSDEDVWLWCTETDIENDPTRYEISLNGSDQVVNLEFPAPNWLRFCSNANPSIEKIIIRKGSPTGVMLINVNPGTSNYVSQWKSFASDYSIIFHVFIYHYGSTAPDSTFTIPHYGMPNDSVSINLGI